MFRSTRSITPLSTISIQLNLIQLSQNWNYKSQIVTGPWQGFKELEISFEQNINHEQITPSFSRGCEGIKTPLWSEHAGRVVERTAEDGARLWYGRTQRHLPCSAENLRARAWSGRCCRVGRNLGEAMGVYETCFYMLMMPQEIRILFCFLHLSHQFAFQYCLRYICYHS